MEFTREENLFQFTDKGLEKVNSIMIISKNEAVRDAELENVVQILDETGESQVICTVDKFVEIFEQDGLSGFIM